MNLSILDERFDYFEERWITAGTTSGKMVVVVARLYFTDETEELFRIISAREATSPERGQYENYG